MTNYKVLNSSYFELKDFKLVPIRHEDRFELMKWRNEQIYHLRQEKPLTVEDQESYFINVVAKLFEQKAPDQILFSFLQNDKLIGYGGLVHINWLDRNAEISFIMKTNLEKEHFKEIWTAFLKLIEEVAFNDLGLHKLCTYAFDLRPHLYIVLEENDYNREAKLVQHCLFNGEFIDVIIHSKINNL